MCDLKKPPFGGFFFLGNNLDSVTLRFTTNWPYSPLSWVVAHATGSRIWSHVMAIVGDTAYESTMYYWCDGRLKSGVRCVPVSVAMAGVKRYMDMTVPVKDVQACVAWAKSQDGAKYDFAGALGLPLLASTDWQDDSSWWCSEHNFMMLGAGGAWLFDRNECTRVTPNDLSMCNFEKSEIVCL